MLVPERKSWLVNTDSFVFVLVSRQRNTTCFAKSFDLHRKMLSGMITTPMNYIINILTCKERVICQAFLGVIFLPAAKVLLFALLTVIVYSPLTRAKRISPDEVGYHCRRQYHSPQGEYNWKTHLRKQVRFSGPSCGTRTHGPQNRNLILYPTELKTEI